MRKTLNLKDGEAEIGQTIWWVDGSELKSLIVTLVMTDLLESEPFNARCDDSTPCFIAKSALLDYCQENNIECIELERDVYKERLESMGAPKTDIEKLLGLCDDFEIKVSKTVMVGKNNTTRGSFVAMANEEMEIRFCFGLDGDFRNFYFLED